MTVAVRTVLPVAHDLRHEEGNRSDPNHHRQPPKVALDPKVRGGAQKAALYFEVVADARLRA
jgi:hypothetical protein